MRKFLTLFVLILGVLIAVGCSDSGPTETKDSKTQGDGASGTVLGENKTDGTSQGTAAAAGTE